MKKERICILVEVDTDPVPGWGNDPEDYVKLIQRQLDNTIPHYNPVVKLSQPHENFTNRQVLDHAHHGPFEKHLFPDCPLCNPSFSVRTKDQEVAPSSS